MSRPATARLKVNPPLGVIPALQYMLPAQLKVDPTYQRSLETGPSISLIRRIAMHWNWDLCQPLVVARRDNGDLFVIDGQHRLEAARLRGDIAQLPAVVVQYASPADEAASFVHLNQQRRPLTTLDVHRAAVAAGDEDACAIADAMQVAGLSFAKTSNPDSWKLGQLMNIGGIQRGWRTQGPVASKVALQALAAGFQGAILRYAGTVYPGIVAVCADEHKLGGMSGRKFEQFTALLASKSQVEWRQLIYTEHAKMPTQSRRDAAERLLRAHWARAKEVPTPPVRPVPPPPPPLSTRMARVAVESDGKRWCDQCDQRVHTTKAALCKSAHCSVRPRLTA
jgi:hypothetical protein